MPDERTRTEQHNAANLPPPADDDGPVIERGGPYERFINWAAELPWWAIILGIVAVVVLYSMLTSAAYREVIRFLTDDPQTTTDDLYNAVLIVGTEIEVVGDFEGETTDSVGTVINQLLRIEGAARVERAGFVLSETAARLTLELDDGTLLTIPKEDIISEERVEVDDRTQVAVTYIESQTVTGTVTDIDDDEMRIRTVDQEQETFTRSRVIDRTVVDIVTCGEDAGPDCHPGDIVTIEREGELLSGTLNTLSNTNMSVNTGEDESREIRLADVEYYVVATLTRAVNAAAASRPITDGDSVRIGYYQDPTVDGYLGDIAGEDAVSLPLIYAEGEVAVELAPYDSAQDLLAATNAGEIDGMIYIAPGPEHTDVVTWLEDNPGADITNVADLVCSKGCDVQVKLVDDEITGRVAEETENKITVVTTEDQFVTIDRDDVLEERKLEPAVCALNNLRGCDAGIFLTLSVTFQAYALALVIGLIVGIMRVQTNAQTLGSKVMQTIFTSVSTLYVEVVRGIPLLVILLYAGFVISPELRDGLLLFDLQWFGDSLPDFQIRPKLNLNDEQEAIMGLAFGYGAFIAEIFRAGIQSISRGQMEAARSLGMSYPQAMRHVILPQAIRVVLPPLGNDFIAMLKDSALISVLALPDLLQLGRLYVSRTFRAFEGYNTVAVLYLLMTLFLSMMVRILERRSRLPG